MQAVNSYDVTREMVGYDRKRARIVYLIAFFAVWLIEWQILFQLVSLPHGRNLLWGFVGSVIGGIVSGIVFALLCEPTVAKRTYPYTLVVSDSSITAIHPGFKRSVSRENVKMIVDKKSPFFGPALRISSHGRLGTWFWGYVLVPKSLPEYESIRKMTASWKTSG